MRALVLALLLAVAAVAGCSDPAPRTAQDAGAGDAASGLTGLALRAVSARNVVLTWDPLTSGEVRVERGDADGVSFAEIARRPGAAGRFLDLALTPETLYLYRLSVCADAGCGPGELLGPVATPATHVPAFEVTVPRAAPTDELAIFDLTVAPLDVGSDGLMVVIDRDGTVVWERFWPAQPLNAVTPIGDHRVACSLNGVLTVLDLDGSTALADASGAKVHHDIKQLPGGDFIAVQWDVFEDPPGDPVVGDTIARYTADLGAITWSWRARDHIPLTDRNDFDMQQPYFGLGHDWTHTNSVTLDEAAGVAYVNVRNLNRLYAVDYPSGDLRWVMGDGGDFGAGLWGHSHDPVFLSDHEFVMFDNGLFRADNQLYSRVIEVDFDAAAQTADIVWEYRETPDFFNVMMGGAEPQTDGNLLVTDAVNVRLLEIDWQKNRLWEARFPTGYWIFRAKPVPRSFFTEW